MKPPTPSIRLVLSIALGAGSIAHAAEPATRPKDAAEAVQEGNVRNWVEYYERQRRESAQKPPAASPTPPAVTTPSATPAAPPR